MGEAEYTLEVGTPGAERSSPSTATMCAPRTAWCGSSSTRAANWSHAFLGVDDDGLDLECPE